jgi:hypothetical protein
VVCGGLWKVSESRRRRRRRRRDDVDISKMKMMAKEVVVMKPSHNTVM